MKKILLFCLSVMVSLSITRAQSNIEFSGDITTDVTWNSGIDTVKIIGNVSIDTIGSLTIESGVVIEFQGAYNIDVEGSIVATGTESAPVIFTVSDTSGYYNYSHVGWLGIDFVNTDENADASTFDYCEFFFGNANKPDYWNSHGGVIFIEFFNKIEIKNSLFKYNYSSGNGGAIHVKDADILVENSVFEYNESGDAGGAVNVSGDAGTCTANLFNNIFENNTSLTGGGVRVRGGGNSSITGNSFQFNKAFETSSECGGGGILITGDADSTIIKDNFLANNEASDGGGIKIAGYSSPILMNNIIVNNTVSEYEGDSYTGNGGGIKIAYYSNPLIINNTIVNNLADYGGGIFTSCSIDSVKIYNSIIYGNITSGDGSQVYIKSTEDSKKIEFYNCNIEGDTTDMFIETGSTDSLVYSNNINVNSEFVNPTTGAGATYTTSAEDWKLNNNSPCIDTGDDTNISYWIPSEDFFGNDRITGDAIDIGAHEYELVRQLEISSPSTTITEDQGTLQFTATVWPEDAANTSVVWSVMDGTATATIDQNGLLTATGTDEGNGTVTVKAVTDDGSNLADEILVTISNQGTQTTINEIKKELIQVYPNPAVHQINIETPFDHGFVEFIDLTGKTIIAKQFDQSFELNISEWSNGLYFVRIVHGSDIYTKKFIKK